MHVMLELAIVESRNLAFIPHTHPTQASHTLSMTSLLTETLIRRILGIGQTGPWPTWFCHSGRPEPATKSGRTASARKPHRHRHGFLYPRAAMIGENDGLSGSLALADALRELGKEVELVTDRHSAALLAAASPLFGKPFPTLILSQDQTLANAEIDALLDRFQPSQVGPSNVQKRWMDIVTQCEEVLN